MIAALHITGGIVIVIYGIKEHLNPVKARLSDVIHGCMKSILGMPEDKRAHRFIPLNAEDFFYPGGRSPAYTVIEINMMQGRTPDTQKALIKELLGRQSLSESSGRSHMHLMLF